MSRIRDLAKICKSKNAGPFDLTVDVVFEDQPTFDHVLASCVLTTDLFARLYKVPPDQVLLTPYPPGLAFKATFPRAIPSGEIGDTDIYGAQQHAPLLNVEIPD